MPNVVLWTFGMIAMNNSADAGYLYVY